MFLDVFSILQWFFVEHAFCSRFLSVFPRASIHRRPNRAVPARLGRKSTASDPRRLGPERSRMESCRLFGLRFSERKKNGGKRGF